MQNNITIQYTLNKILEVIADINKMQEEYFIEDLDYIKLYLANAVNYKEIKEENGDVYYE